VQCDGDQGGANSGVLSLGDKRRESEGKRRWTGPVLREIGREEGNWPARKEQVWWAEKWGSTRMNRMIFEFINYSI
jgi:hypothetical protein